MNNEQQIQTPIKEKKEGFLVKNIFFIIAFLLPFFLMLFAFIRLKVYPFGDQQILVVDAWHQYFPFLNELREKLLAGESLFYSWNIGGGANFLAVMGYYASSPLYLLSVLCPKEYLTEFMAFITLVKISFSGLTFAIYLKGMHKKDDFSIAAFATLYALSGFAMGYYWSLMWLDGMALLPLVILGLNKLIDEGKYKLFTFSLAIALIANYYIGAFICMFVALYYIVAYLSRYKITDWRRLLKITGRAIVFSAIGVALAAIIVIPVFFALQHASASTNEFPKEVNFYKPWLDIFNDLFTGIGPNKKEMTGSINIGCGMISIILFFAYAICKKINIKERVAHIAFIVFIFISFNINVLDFILHGLHFPNELPHRYSFVFSFFLLAVGYKAFVNLRYIKASYIVAVMTGLVGYALIANKIYGEGFSEETTLIAITFTVLYAGAMLIFIKSKKEMRDLVLAAMILIVAAGEGTIASQRGVMEVGSSGRDAYVIGKSETENIVSDIYAEDGDFYRLENTNTYTINQGAFYSYRGLSQFNSSCNSRVTAVMNKLGMSGNVGSNRYTYHLQTPIFNSLFNVKYIINRTGETDSEYLTLKAANRDVFAYNYKYYLPVGIVTTESIRSWNMNIGNPFETQNSLFKLASGITDEVLVEIPKTDTIYEDMVLTDNGQEYSYTQSDSSLQPYVELSYTAENNGTAYAYVSALRAVDREISITVTKKDGSLAHSEIYNMGHPYIAELGYCEKGDVIKVSFSIEGAQSGIFDSYVYMCDTEKFEKGYSLLNDETMTVTDFSSTKIKGTVTSKNNSVLYTSIFYEEGWHAKVDGKKVEIKPLQESIITVDLPAGTHEVEFYYVPEGFVTGILISLAGLLIMIFLIIMNILKKKIPIMDILLSNDVKVAPAIDEDQVIVRDISDGFEVEDSGDFELDASISENLSPETEISEEKNEE